MNVISCIASILYFMIFLKYFFVFLSRVGHLGPTLDTVMGFCESFFVNFGRFEWDLIAVFGSF